MRATAAVFFLVVLFAPLAARLIGIKPAEIENRALASRPALEVRETLKPGYFERKWAIYLRDQLPFRDRAADFRAQVSLLAFKESPNPRVIVGREGFLFLDREIDRACQNQVPVARMVDNARAWADWFASRGGRLVLVLVPDKAMVYADRLTDAGARRHACTQAKNEALRAGLATVGNLTYIDLYPELARMAAGAATPIYHLHDTHWLGSVSAMLPRRIVESLQPGLWRDEAIVAVDHLHGQDLSRMIGVQEEAPDIRFTPRVQRAGIVAEGDPASAVPRRIRIAGEGPLFEKPVALISDSFFNKSLDALEMHMRDIAHLRPSRLDEPAAAQALRERPVLVVQAVMRNAHEIFSTQLTSERLGQVVGAP